MCAMGQATPPKAQAAPLQAEFPHSLQKSFATAVLGPGITRARAVAKICREKKTFCDKFCDTSGPLASWQDPARARRLCARLHRRSGPHAPAHRAEAGRVQTPL